MSAERAIPETPEDRKVWAELWAATADAWGKVEDLAEVLGIHRSTVQRYTSTEVGTDRARFGPWPALRAAMLRTARRRPEAVPAIVQAFARHVLDARGVWLPEVEGDDLDPVAELGDVTIAHAQLMVALRRGASLAEIEQLAHELQREAGEAAAAAVQGSQR